MKTIVLTGSTGGLGKSLVDVIIADKDYELICMYRNQQKFEECFGKKEAIQGYLIKQNDDFSALPESVEIRKCDGLILILNAFSISPIKRVGDYSPDEIEEFVYGNLTRNILLLNTVVNHCKKNNKTLRIINLDSGAADYPLTGWGNYCAAKAYINSFISVIALENPSFEIVSFDPGVMNTDMQAEIRATKKTVFDQVETFKRYKEENRLNEPIAVAKQIYERYVAAWTTQDMREKMR